jgi:hypothetical protein
LADPVGLAPQIVFERLGVQGTAAVDDEGLIFLDAAEPGAGWMRQGRGAAPKNSKRLLPLTVSPLACGQPGF